MGLTAPGQGAKAIMEGWTQADGKLPINPSGGLKSKGHPIGATGVSMHVMAAMQLNGSAGDIQLKAPKLGGEIGRASWRERGCQYVSISVGVVALNKTRRKK